MTLVPFPYLKRAYSLTPSHIERAITGTYTMPGGGSCLKAKKNRAMPIPAEITCTSAIMTGEYNG